MAELQQTQVLPAPFIQAAAQTYLDDLTSAVGDYSTANLAQTMGPQFVAGLDPLQQQAASLTQQGVGSFRPFLQSAQASTGPQAYEAFMSPYQRDVISTTLQDFDRQAQKGLGSIAQNAITAGAFGGARQGVAESEYMAQSDRNRAALQAGLLQQGFGQAQQAAQQNFANQMNLAGTVPALQGQEIAGLQTIGSGLQAQNQAVLQAQQQLAQAQLMQPTQAAQTFGSGVTGLIAGYPGQTTNQMIPSPSPISTALGVGTGLAGIYRLIRGND